jgi:hypothetical protein
MGAVAVDPRVGRSGDPEQVGTEEMDAHSAQRRGTAHHGGDVAHVGGVADIALGEGDLDVLEAGGGGPDLVERRLAGSRRGRGQSGGDDRQHKQLRSLIRSVRLRDGPLPADAAAARIVFQLLRAPARLGSFAARAMGRNR